MGMALSLLVLHDSHNLDDESKLEEGNQGAADASHKPDLDGSQSLSWNIMWKYTKIVCWTDLVNRIEKHH